jgi:hypothetical protein
MSTEPPTPQTPIEILQAALKKEKGAYPYYDTLLNTTTVFFYRNCLNSSVTKNTSTCL